MANKAHIQLLTDAEVESLYAKPSFNDIERQGYFYLEGNEHERVAQWGTLKSKVFFILQLGYFRAMQQFYSFSLDDVADDIEYIITRHFGSLDVTLRGTLSTSVYRQQQHCILTHYGYTAWNASMKPTVVAQLQRLIMIHPKGHDTLHELLAYFEKEHIIIPSYRTFQDLFTHALRIERERLDAIIATIPDDLQERLQDIIANNDGVSYLNTLRADQKDFNYTAIKTETEKAHTITKLYHLVKTLLPTLGLSNNAIRYYATLAHHYVPARTRKLRQQLQYLYVLCFIYHRYQTIMDNLIMSFVLHIKRLMDDGSDCAKQQEAEYRAAILLDFPSLVTFLRWSSADTIAPDTPYEIFSQEAFKILPKEKQSELANFIEGLAFDTEGAKWAYYESQSRRIAMYLRPIMLAVDFQYYQPDSTVLALIAVLRDFYAKKRPPSRLLSHVLPELLNSISKHDRALLADTKNPDSLHPARFEVYVYRKMFHLIENGRLFCNDSVSYCELEADLVDDALVDKADEIAGELGYDKIASYCDERLDVMLNALESAWQKTNSNIANGQNTGIKIEENDKGIKTWSLTYDADETIPTGFFDEAQQVDIADVFKVMGDKLDLWSKYLPLKDRYTKIKEPDAMLLLGCTLSDGFGFGVKNMAKISNVGYETLRTIDENFMFVENLCNINDSVSNYIHAQEVSRTWDLLEDQIIGDADGQKYGTRHHTLQSRYSSKYFGTYKGVSVYTLVANHIPINAKIIGPNEHESHHLYDVVYNNTTDVKLDAMTGDMHSRNQANHVVLDSINIAYIPSIKHISAEAEKLYSVNDPSTYTGLIRPCDKIDVDLIRAEKRGIIRILLSLLLQHTTQAVIIRKLASHKRYTRLRAALWEYNKIFHSIHVLNSVDDMGLRKAIKTARNRTEAYHQLHRTIRNIHSGVFRGKRIVDNAISGQASRLLTTIIIGYNTMILEQIYQGLVKKVGKARAKAIMSKISPVSWGHIIFTGRYDLRGPKGKIDIAKLVDFLAERLNETL